MEKEGVTLPEEEKIDLYVGVMGDDARYKAYNIVSKLREKGFIVETDYMDRSVKAQMKYANKLSCKYTLILGDNELESGRANLKNMDNGENIEVSLDEIDKYL